VVINHIAKGFYGPKLLMLLSFNAADTQIRFYWWRKQISHIKKLMKEISSVSQKIFLTYRKVIFTKTVFELCKKHKFKVSNARITEAILTTLHVTN
jgi:hypothetical protein